MKYDYTPRLGPRGTEQEPLVNVVFTNPKNGKNIEVFSLIDSGAGSIILNGQFAEILGINLQTGKEHLYQGIAHNPVIAYDHQLLIRLKEDTNEYSVECSFLPELKASAVLGQRGFFENYKIVFERYKKRIEITPIPTSHGK